MTDIAKAERMMQQYRTSTDPAAFAADNFEQLWKLAWKVLNSDEAANPRTGELICASCAEHQDHIERLIATQRGLMLQIAALKADEEKQLKELPYYTQAIELWRFYQDATGRKRAKFDKARYKLVAKFLKEENLDQIKLAILGVAYQPHKEQMNNGSWEVYNSWELVFRDRAHYEKYANRAPRPALDAFKKAEPVTIEHLLSATKSNWNGMTRSQMKVPNK